MSLHNLKVAIHKSLISTIILLITIQITVLAATRSVALSTDIPVLQQKPKINNNLKPSLAPQTIKKIQQQNPRLTLKANRDHIQVYEDVKFVVEPSNQVVNSPYDFIFHIDGNAVVRKPKNRNFIIYRFSKKGNHIVWVKVQSPTGSEIFVPRPIVVNRLPVQVNEVQLTVTPDRVKEGQTVLLQTEFKSTIQNIRYRFFFGENPTSYSQWTPSPGISHGYPAEGTYKVFAEIGAMANNRVRLLTRSVTREVIVDAEPAPQTQGVKLIADRTQAYTGEQFRFTLSPSEAVLNNAIKIFFDFGDGNRIEREPGTYVVTHRYKDAGHYTVIAIIRSVPTVTHVAPIPAIENTVDVQVDNVPLKVDPVNTETGETITFEVGFRTDDPQIRYRFVFGDNSPPSEWISDPITTHRYSSSGSYHTYAEIATRSDTSVVPLARSIARTVTISLKPVVTNPPDNPYRRVWVYVILVLLAVSAISYRIRKYYSASQTKFEPRVDKGEQSVSDGNKLTVNYEIRCNPNHRDGHFKLTASQPDLIQNIKRKK